MGTESDTSLLGPTGTIFLLLYLSSLLLIGWLGRRARKDDSLTDFYLGGRGLGTLVLFLTLYATQYSGNTLVGYAGVAYRSGFRFIVSVIFMMSIVGGYLLFAPRLQALAARFNFLTLGDYLQHRYADRRITILATGLATWALANYILSNLKAIGFIVETTTGGRIPFAYGVLLLSLIMVVYETLGGFRSVAWTDAIQGVLLLSGCLVIFVAIQIHYGGLIEATSVLAERSPHLLAPPDAAATLTWLSTVAIIFLGVPFYPQAIQRIYAAGSAASLKRAFQIMVFMPLVTTFFIFYIGIVAAAYFPGLDRAASETVALRVLNDLSSGLPSLGWMLVLFVAAVVAAIMSTVDSALLAISSIVTQDLYRPTHPDASQRRLTYVGKLSSWGIMAIAAGLAIILPQTIWRLTEIKLELLCQVAPAVLLGIHIKSLSACTVLTGMTAGTFLTVILMSASWLNLGPSSKPLGIHAGIWGCALNFALVGLLHRRERGIR
ncbi:MAG: sodium:pantothenate symporter [Gemmatimonadetes bacterium]|nr:sodium:pantothenate symporter [Gemmatimonadota bacterium]|tara:strand:- start:272 stop:1747 length:1476 start_codon:yes stop_codon:yes gene_type:complete